MRGSLFHFATNVGTARGPHRAYLIVMFTVDPRIVSINNATERKLTATHLKSSGALEEFSCHPFSSSGSSESSLPFDLSSLRITSADGQIIDVAQFLPSDWPPGDLQLIVLGADPQNLVFSLTEAYSTSLYGFMNSSTMDVSIGGVSAQPGQFIRLAMGVPQWSSTSLPLLFYSFNFLHQSLKFHLY